MRALDVATKYLSRLDPRLVAVLERLLRKLPAVRAEAEKEYDSLLAELEPSLKPYRGEFPAFGHIPSSGLGRESILQQMEQLKEKGEKRWREGFVSGAVYHGDEAHIDFLNRVV